MNKIVYFSITADLQIALKKLAKADIAVYNLKKYRSKVYFGVNQQYCKKVFAIFAHPCYNTVIRQKSVKMRAADFIKNRLGFLVGVAVFLAAAIASNNVVFKIKITGSGSYLSPSVISIARECGAREYTFCSRLDKPLLEARVMALKGVSFCSVQKSGSYLIIDVRAQDGQMEVKAPRPLISSVSGKLEGICAVCGTAQKSVGDTVEKGEVLIAPYVLREDGERLNSLAVGWAQISQSLTLSLFFEERNEDSDLKALAAPALYEGKITDKSFSVSPCEGGVTYKVSFTRLLTLSINME